MDATTYALDLAKSVFQLHWVDPHSGEIHRRKLPRGKLSDFFAQRQPARVVMEACGSAHHWARVFSSQGHQVELLPPHKVREHISGNKSDAADARGIWIAAHQADIRRVSVKSAQQQADLAAHRVRSQWVGMRTATVNALRALLYEFGVVLPKGRLRVLPWLVEHRAMLEAQVPPLALRLMDSQVQALRELDRYVEHAEIEIEQVQRTSEVAKRLRQVPGIGVLGATALSAMLGDGSAWRNAREFACCLGLVPRHSGTGGKVRMASISKRGDSYPRTLLIHGARNLVRRAQPPEWIARMLKRRPFNVVTVAVAHKLARTAWAMVAHGTAYEDRWHAIPGPGTAA